MEQPKIQSEESIVHCSVYVHANIRLMDQISIKTPNPMSAFLKN
jgi:hypothetical protein